jgi:hypothetical protein
MLCFFLIFNGLATECPARYLRLVIREFRHQRSQRPGDPVTLQRIVGGKLVALKPDESLESFQSNRPSPPSPASSNTCGGIPRSG